MVQECKLLHSGSSGMGGAACSLSGIAGVGGGSLTYSALGLRGGAAPEGSGTQRLLRSCSAVSRTSWSGRWVGWAAVGCSTIIGVAGGLSEEVLCFEALCEFLQRLSVTVLAPEATTALMTEVAGSVHPATAYGGGLCVYTNSEQYRGPHRE
mmetsp:Transcript_52783/g.160061  ORF Transcript_52783/g.160061 Transcript_52783/m.160061 type:complete len:152 (-) Transcript_52783:97-552(-)